jgi:hypothetical protein
VPGIAMSKQAAAALAICMHHQPVIHAAAGANGTVSPGGTIFLAGGASETLTFTATPGYEVKSVTVNGQAVSQIVGGQTASYQFTNVTDCLNVVALFGAPPTITATAGSNGSISPAGTVTAFTGTNVTYNINAAPGYEVQNVEIDGAASAGAVTSYTFTNVSTSHTIAATFMPATYPMNVALAGTGTGRVSGGAINCSSGSTVGCSANIANGSSVTLNATAGTNSIFVGWSGIGCTGTGPCTVSMTAAKYAMATFQPSTFALTASTLGAGGGTISGGAISCTTGSTSGCTANLAYGTSLTLSATPNANSVFKGWSGSCSGTGSCNVTATAPMSAYATFQPSTYALTVNPYGTGTGTVTGGGINCTSGSTTGCSVAVGDTTPYTVVTLTATAGTGSLFKGWSGGCYGTATTCNVTMSQVQTVYPNFSH